MVSSADTLLLLLFLAVMRRTDASVSINSSRDGRSDRASNRSGISSDFGTKSSMTDFLLAVEGTTEGEGVWLGSEGRLIGGFEKARARRYSASMFICSRSNIAGCPWPKWWGKKDGGGAWNCDE